MLKSVKKWKILKIKSLVNKYDKLQKKLKQMILILTLTMFMNQKERKKDAEENLQSRNKLLVGIREGLDHLVETLVI
jgi:hypothetical protein